MDPLKRKFAFKRGVLGVGLPVAVVMSITMAFQKPGFVAQFQAFNPKTFLIALLLFTPIFSVAGWFWGLWVHGFTRRP